MPDPTALAPLRLADTAPAMVALAEAHLGLLLAYLAVRGAERRPLRVDYGTGDGMWRPGSVRLYDPTDPDYGALVELDEGGEPAEVALRHLRPHQPCRCNNPDLVRAAGDIRFCTVRSVR